MKVGDLKKLLEGAPDDAPVLVPDHDHGYREVSCELATGLKKGRNQWTEDFGESVTPQAQFGQRMPILVVGR